MSPSARADAPLLAGAALAEQLGAEWFAVTVLPEPRSALSPETSRGEVLSRNARLAETLGASVVVFTADDPPGAAIAFAKAHDATHAIFGHDPASPRSILATGSFVQRFSAGVRGIELQVVKIT